jgi:DNA polymerase I
MYADLIERVKIRRDEKAKELETFLNNAMGYIPITTTQGGLFGEDKVTVHNTINLNSTKQVMEAFAKIGIELPNTSKLTVESLVNKYPELKFITNYRAEQILVTTFGEKILGFIDDESKRIHSTFFQLLTETGRFSCSKPNAQQYPSSKEFRECFRPTEEGRCFVIADYSQLELRILAQYSQDPVMLHAFNNDIDLHSTTAKNAFNLPCDVKDVASRFPKQRKLGKILNFSISYGVGPTKYSITTGITISEAKKTIQGFYNTYTGAKNWLYGIEDFGIQNKYIRNLAGRKIKLYFDQSDEKAVAQNRRNARSYTIQSLNADILKEVMPILYNKLQAFNNAWIVNIVHDEIILECDIEDASEIAQILTYVMESVAKKYLVDVKVDAESKICESWADKDA